MGGLEFLHGAKVRVASGLKPDPRGHGPKKEAPAVAKASLTNN